MRKMEKVTKTLVIAILAIASAAVISACANSGTPDAAPFVGTAPVPPDQVPLVGMMVCVDCHSQQTADWLTGHGANNAHRSYPISAECAECHDQTGDGYSLYPTLFDAPRPTVSCESCHGGGANHYGIGAIPYPRPGYAVCGQCHNSEHHSSMTLIEEYTERQAEGGGHISSINTHVFTDATQLWVRPLCARCHTNEGFKEFAFLVPGSTGHDALVDLFIDVPNYLASEMQPVQCGTCHNAHLATTGNPALWMPASVDNATTTTINELASAEFNMCTSCHQVYKADGPANSTITADAANAATCDERVYVRGAFSGTTQSLWTAEVITGGIYGVGTVRIYETATPANIIKADYAPTGSNSSYVALANNIEFRIRESSPVGNVGLVAGCKWNIVNDPFKSYHDPDVNTYGSAEEIIADSHIVIPGDTRQNSGVNQEAVLYVNRQADNACSACHNVHSANIEINEQWRESGHGDLLGDPWIHYNWKGASRASCQRCHTATGAMNYLDDPVGYLPANNDFTLYVAGSGTGSPADNGQLETLYCWSCHTNSQTGEVRDPGAVSPGYKNMDNSLTVFADVEASNVCLACHTGRESGGNVWNSAGNFANLSFINSHYLTGGAMVFQASGFEFNVVDASLDYTDPVAFEHKLIGTAGAAGTGEEGPCVGCHMSAEKKHLFNPVQENETTMLEEIASPTCALCHTPATPGQMTIVELEAEADLLHDALGAFDVQLQQRGIFFYPSHPYFFTAPYDPAYVETGACTGKLAVKNWQTGGTNTYTPVAPVPPSTTWTCTWAGAGGTAGTGKQNMGAAFNFNLIEHDPGAFAHNSFYTKRLIYDSIDWLDNNLMDDSVQTTLNAAPHAGALYQAGAIEYILNYAACTPGVDCRP